MGAVFGTKAPEKAKGHGNSGLAQALMQQGEEPI